MPMIRLARLPAPSRGELAGRRARRARASARLLDLALADDGRAASAVSPALRLQGGARRACARRRFLALRGDLGLALRELGAGRLDAAAGFGDAPLQQRPASASRRPEPAGPGLELRLPRAADAVGAARRPPAPARARDLRGAQDLGPLARPTRGRSPAARRSRPPRMRRPAVHRPPPQPDDPPPHRATARARPQGRRKPARPASALTDDQAQVLAEREVLVGDRPEHEVPDLLLGLGDADRDRLGLDQAGRDLEVVADEEAGARRGQVDRVRPLVMSASPLVAMNRCTTTPSCSIICGGTSLRQGLAGTGRPPGPGPA